MDHYNIGEFNRGQSSRLLQKLVKEDKTAFIQKYGKPMAVVLSKARYDRLMNEGIDINDH
jgi:PHD/YefM family antitoxin component YafN of YafNO toxin-antitoxin module